MLITLQAARGTTSHFNVTTRLDSVVFNTMGLVIALNTAAAAAALWLLPPVTPGRAAYVWGLRLGLVIFVLGSLIGAVMIVHNAHTFGLPDGGPGLPFVNWSTKAGDLRVAHFVGLHALQALPIAGAIIDHGAARQAWSARSWLLGGVALLWASVVIGLLLQALGGRPVLG